MNWNNLLAGATAGMVLAACGGGSSPEDATKSFVQALSDGNCDKALEMAVDDAKKTVQASVDSECEGFKTEIKSVKCEVEGETATCLCEEKRTGMDVKWNYDLKKVSDDWKVSNYNKDMGDLGGELGKGLSGGQDATEE